MDEYQMSAWLYKQWRDELAAIEAREFEEPLDHTRAAILRASMRAEEVTLIRLSREVQS